MFISVMYTYGITYKQFVLARVKHFKFLNLVVLWEVTAAP